MIIKKAYKFRLKPTPEVEQMISQPEVLPKISVGVDLGVAKFAALSNGKYIEPIHSFRQHSEKLAIAQRRLSKKNKFSSNWQKQAQKVRQLHTKIANIRRDFLHKHSTILSKNHAMIAVELLQVKNMSKSAKGDIDNPGTQVSAKSGLNKSILDQGWYEFKRQLNYKLTWLCGVLVEVPPKNTSIRCSRCQYESKSNRLSQDRFCCISCHHTENADVNAAKNILAAGHAVLACGASA